MARVGEIRENEGKLCDSTTSMISAMCLIASISAGVIRRFELFLLLSL